VDYKDNYPDPTLKIQQQLQATSAFHHTCFNNLPLFDEDKSLVARVGLV